MQRIAQTALPCVISFRIHSAAQPCDTATLKFKARVLPGAMTYLRLLRKFIRRLGGALRQLTAWQSPWALLTKRQRKELSKRELVFLAIRSDANGNGVLRHVAT